MSTKRQQDAATQFAMKVGGGAMESAAYIGFLAGCEWEAGQARHNPTITDGDWVEKAAAEIRGIAFASGGTAAWGCYADYIRKHLPKQPGLCYWNEDRKLMELQPDDGVKAAAWECWNAVYDETGPWSNEQAPPDAFNAIIARHCVGREQVKPVNEYYAESQRLLVEANQNIQSLRRQLKWAQEMGEKHHEGDRAATAAADRLQEQLNEANARLRSIRIAANTLDD
jgi:hypothetical protein